MNNLMSNDDLLESEDTIIIDIDDEGDGHFLWDDRLAGLGKLGQLTVTRASHVEPTEDGRWTADLAPVNGPVFGPFVHRQEALDAEKAWILENVFG